MAALNESIHYCKLCRETFEKLSTYVSHLESYPHRIKEAMEAPVAERKQNANLGYEDVYRCQVCDIFVTGLIPFKQHIDGLKHKKKLRNRELTDVLLNSVSDQMSRLSLGKETGDYQKSTSDAIRQSSPVRSSLVVPFPFACQPCGKKFSGAEPYQQHLISALHYKKTNIAKENESPLNIYVCKSCNVNFSGPVPYQQHMESPKHAKQMEVLRNWSALPTDADSRKDDFDRLFGHSSSSVEAIKKETEMWEELSRVTQKVSKELPGDISCIGADEPVNLSFK